MLFTKKSRFMINERQIKEELKNDDGETVVKLNLRFPELKCPKNDVLLKYAVPFYSRLAEGLADYARSDMLKSAKEAKAVLQEEFSPYSAVMRWEKAWEDDDHLSLMIDVSLSNGSVPITERQTQTWNRKSGSLCKAQDFIDKRILKDALSVKKNSASELFVLREGGIEVFLREDGRYRGVFIGFI